MNAREKKEFFERIIGPLDDARPLRTRRWFLRMLAGAAAMAALPKMAQAAGCSGSDTGTCSSGDVICHANNVGSCNSNTCVAQNTCSATNGCTSYNKCWTNTCNYGNTCNATDQCTSADNCSNVNTCGTNQCVTNNNCDNDKCVTNDSCYGTSDT